MPGRASRRVGAVIIDRCCDEQHRQGVFQRRNPLHRLDMGDVEQKEQAGDQAQFAVGAQAAVGQRQTEAGEYVAGDGEQMKKRWIIAPGRVSGPHHQLVDRASGDVGLVR